MNRVLAAAVFVVLFSEGMLLAQGYGGVGFPGGGGKGMGSLAAAFCSLTGCTMTGQVVFSGVSTDISTASGETLTLSPAGTGASVSNVQIVSGDTAATATDWQDTSFNWSNGTTQGVRLQAGNLDFTSNTFLVWQPGTIRGSTLALSVQTLNNTITLTGLTKLAGPLANYAGQASFSGTNHNYTGCTNYSYCRLIGTSTPVITGMTSLAASETRFMCNYGSVNIQFNHEDANSTAANRFYLPGAANYALVPQACMFIIYDSSMTRWMKSA